MRIIQEVSKSLTYPLPADLIEIYTDTNGFEGSISEWLNVILWPVEDLVPNNIGYGVSSFFPGLVIVGSGATGQALGYLSRAATEYIEVSFVGFEEMFARTFCGTFFEFLTNLNEGRQSVSIEK